MDAQTVLQRAVETHLRLVRFLYCDNGGIIRGKATHVNGLARRMGEGIGQTLAMQAFAGVDALAAVEGLGPVGEFRLLPDPSTFVVLPYVPNSGMMLCDMLTLEPTLGSLPAHLPEAHDRQRGVHGYHHAGRRGARILSGADNAQRL